jgi:hypothetical protein
MLDPRQNILGEFFVRSDLGVRRGDTDMRFVDANTLRLRWPLVLENIFLLLGRVPEACIVNRGDIKVLGNACDPSGYAFLTRVVVRNDKRDLGII